MSDYVLCHHLAPTRAQKEQKIEFVRHLELEVTESLSSGTVVTDGLG